MSWDNIKSKDLQSHNISVTHLLSSPDGSRYLVDNSNDFSQITQSHSRLAGCIGSSGGGGGGGGVGGATASLNGGASLWVRNSTKRKSVINCFFVFERSLRQYMARRKIERGLRLYEQHNQSAAVRVWCSALDATTRQDDCFRLLGYLYQAHMDWGKYREAIDFCHRQMAISEEIDSSNMRAETYMNLARAHERLGGLERALSYARHSLYNECSTQCRTGGLVHLTVARVYLEMGGFSRALEGLQGANKIATAIGDSALELQVYVTLSELFGRLKDNDKSATYASKAYDLSRSLQLGDLNSTHHRAALLRMAAALRKQGDLGDAHDYCVEATRLALISGDQATYTRSIRVMGDIYRKKMDIDRSFRQYEQSMGTSAALGDRMAQMEAMDGAARCLEQLRLQQKICNCRPLEFNTRLLEVASSIGAKFLVRNIRSRLALIYRALGDEEQYKTHTRLAIQTDAALGLNCAFCGKAFGLEPDSLEALPCAHILHARCAQDLLKKRDRSSGGGGGGRICPACSKINQSRMHLGGSTTIADENHEATHFQKHKHISIEDIRSLSCDDLMSKTTQIRHIDAPATFCAGERKFGGLLHNTARVPRNELNNVGNNIYSGFRALAPHINSTALLLDANNAMMKPIYHSNLSLSSLSLRASSLTVDSLRNTTSSV